MRRRIRLASARPGPGKQARTRAGLGKALMHGLIGWGILVGAIVGIVVTRYQLAQADRVPLAAFSVQLPTADTKAWKSFPPYQDSVPVLVYHGIGGHRTYLTVSRALFAEQMTALKLAGFHTLTLRQYVAFVHGNTTHLPSRPILLTFDDGRLDAYRAANAILKADGFHATEIVVPGWVNSNPKFSVNWSEINRMSSGGTWDIVEHYGYGREGVRINAAGNIGGLFGDLQYIPGAGNHPGHMETFAQFQEQFTKNMLWGEQQLKLHLPGYQPIAMAIPRSDYGQTYTNDQRIPPYVISWLDRHFQMVFGGDYLNTAPNRPYEFEGRDHRMTTKISYRITMGPQEILPVLRCRLLDWTHNRPIWWEYNCLKLAKSQSSPQVSAYIRLPANQASAPTPALPAIGERREEFS
jgi:hypothetical protein